MKQKFYAVKNGHKIGVFDTWEECKASVDGFSGAEYKSFKTREEALAFVKGEEFVTEQKAALVGHPDEATAYVDGSFNPATGAFACGVVMLVDGKEITFNQAYTDAELAKMRNVAGEICGSILAMRYCIKNKINTLHLYYDYEGIEKWCMGVWKTNKPGTLRYKEFYNSTKDKLTVKFHKVKGHSGDKYNDMADALAKEAAGIE